ncbi:MAG TPA: DNA-3-methyladenine glycosylase I [Chloroflexota bacterium]|nr:DNA-3-methyladenine glycosylase I [Chloroflexota bacterium]
MTDKVPTARPSTDDEYFEELTKSVFQGGLSWQVIEAKWPGFRRAFSNFSVREVSDYLPEDVDRLMSDRQIVRNLQKIEATIENAAEMLLVGIEYGSFRAYLESFETPEAAAEDVAGRFRQVGRSAAAAFVHRVTGQPVAC